MDKFDQTMQQMMEMAPGERTKMIEGKKRLCICGSCPTYNECARQNKELLYCALGKSPECITQEKRCICPSCPLTDQMGLVHEFFCTKGSEKEQRRM